jgi:hypothetical protein
LLFFLNSHLLCSSYLIYLLGLVHSLFDSTAFTSLAILRSIGGCTIMF